VAAGVRTMSAAEKSANEIESLVLKAARGGGLPLGLAEDLAMASAYLDLDALRACPCAGGAAGAISTALDRVAAGEGAQDVTADAALIAAYVALSEQQFRQLLIWEVTESGATFKAYDDEKPVPDNPKGRRIVPPSLLDHLNALAAKTLVPETGSSRSAGAGAGLTDND